MVKSLFPSLHTNQEQFFGLRVVKIMGEGAKERAELRLGFVERRTSWISIEKNRK